jgi:hypothetical protein
MKNLPFILLILFFISCKNGKEFTIAVHLPSIIDSLKTETEIQDYIRTLDSNLNKYYLADYSRIITYSYPHIDSINRNYAKQLGIDKTFYKTDFNNDGYTDLLLIGGWLSGTIRNTPPNDFYQFNSQVVINGGTERSKTYSIALDYNHSFVPQIVKTDSIPYLVLHYPQKLDTIFPPQKDSVQIKLFCKSGQFVELNTHPVKHHKIKKIEFTTNFWETAPSFQMVLNKNKESWFIAIANNFEKNSYNEGAFKANVGGLYFDELARLLNYIDFENLPEDYSIYKTGPPSEALRITYDNGKVKEIYNYAGAGTYGLQAVCNKIKELRFSQGWKPAKEPKNIRIPMPEQRLKWRV